MSRISCADIQPALGHHAETLPHLDLQEGIQRINLFQGPQNNYETHVFLLPEHPDVVLREHSFAVIGELGSNLDMYATRITAACRQFKLLEEAGITVVPHRYVTIANDIQQAQVIATRLYGAELFDKDNPEHAEHSLSIIDGLARYLERHLLEAPDEPRPEFAHDIFRSCQYSVTVSNEVVLHDVDIDLHLPIFYPGSQILSRSFTEAVDKLTRANWRSVHNAYGTSLQNKARHISRGVVRLAQLVMQHGQEYRLPAETEKDSFAIR